MIPYMYAQAIQPTNDGYLYRNCWACTKYYNVPPLTSESDVHERNAALAWFHSFQPFEPSYDAVTQKYTKYLCPDCAANVPPYDWQP